MIGIFEGMANGIIGAINAVITAWNDFELKLGGQTLFAGTPFEVRLPSVTISTPNTGLISSLSLGRLSAGSSTISASGGRGGGSGGGGTPASRGPTGVQSLLMSGSTGIDLLNEIGAATGTPADRGIPALQQALADLGASPAQIAAITARVGGGGGGGAMMDDLMGGGPLFGVGNQPGPSPGTVLLPQHGFTGVGNQPGFGPGSNQPGPSPGTVLLPQHPIGIGNQPGPSPTPRDYPEVNIIVRGDINSELGFQSEGHTIVKEAIREAVA